MLMLLSFSSELNNFKSIAAAGPSAGKLRKIGELGIGAESPIIGSAILSLNALLFQVL